MLVEASGQACGATIRGVDLSLPLDEETVTGLRSAWLEHKVLAFPDQRLNERDQERFTRCFGPFGDDPFFDPIDDAHPHIAAIHRGADEDTPLFADSWHADWSFQEFPPDGTCLYAKVIPPTGGDTIFADQERALADMPADLRERIDTMTAIHSAQVSYAPDGMYGEEDAAAGRQMAIRFDDSAYATQTHPLVRTHPETGARTLYSTIGYIIGIEGLDEDAGRELLLEIYRYQTADAVHYRLEWEPNMLVLWDNRCVLHRATGGYEGYERLLHRTTIGYNPVVRAAR